MKRDCIILTTTTLVLLLSACGGDGKGRFDTGNEKVIVSNCETYITIQVDDLLVKDSTNTTIKIVHDANDTKQVCVVSGSAHIIREK